MTSKIIIIVSMLISAYAAFYIVQQCIPTHVQESVLIDKTDSLGAPPDANEIVALLHPEGNKWQNIKLRVQTISNVRYNPIVTVELPSVIPLFTNPIERGNDVSVFIHTIQSQIDSINSLPVGFHSSSIYRTVMEEINTLATFEGKQKTVLIYSDLLEHSALCNMYTTHNQAVLKNNPQQIEAIFENTVKPGNLKGIQVYFVFRPRTEKENDSFARMVEVYTHILERAGATVSVGANLIENKTNPT